MNLTNIFRHFILRCSALLVIVILLSSSFSYAAEKSIGAPKKEIGSSVNFSTTLSSSVIRGYSTYKGKNAKRIPILTYHKIVPDSYKYSRQYKNDKWTVAESEFNKQMAWLYKKHYRTINCDEFYLWHQGKIKLPERSVLITIDDGRIGSVDRMLKTLRKYNMKGTAFIIGKPAVSKNSGMFMTKHRMKRVRKVYPKFEFQSHTYGMHYRSAYKNSYKVILKDAETQKKYFGFNYIAYPYGNKSNTMIRAYKKSGLRMGFSFADYGYATRLQNRFKIKRIAVFGYTSMYKFRQWCP